MSRIVRHPDRTALPDAGPSPIRYLAVLGGSCLAVLVTVVLVPLLGHGVREAFCGQGDTACSPPAPAGPIGPTAQTTCRVLSHADVVPEDAVVFTDDLGSSGRLTLSRTVDKNAVVHWYVRRDGRPGSAFEKGGELTEFPTEAAARTFITAAQHEPVRNELAKADPTGLLPRIADQVDGHRRPEEVVQQPHAYFANAGSALDLGAQARTGVTGTIIGGGVTGVAEVRVTSEERPTTTLFVELTDAAAQPFRLSDAGLGKTVVSVAIDGQGSPQQLVIETAGRLRGWLRPSADIPEALMSGLLDDDRSAEPFTGRVSIRIDLLRTENADAAADALHWLGVPLLLESGDQRIRPGVIPEKDPVRTLYALLDTGAPGTSTTVSAYRVGKGSPEVGLGMLGGLTVRGALPGDDFYYAPGQGLVRWQTCAS